jgi:predicted MFS family arabinose efflux permease
LRLIILADIGRGLALLVVPLAAWFDFLSMPVLYVVGFLVGTGGIIGWAAYQVFMAERVGNKHLVDANAGIALSDSASQLVGPGLAGAIIHWLTAPFAILADALSFLFSAWILRAIPAKPSDEPKLASDSPGWRAIWADSKEGLAMILAHPVLKTIAFTLMGWNILKHAYIAIVILYAAKDLGLSPGAIGALFMIAGLGFLLATATIRRFNARFGVGNIMLGGLTLTAVSWLLIAAVPKNSWTPLFLGMAMFVLDLGVMLFFINYLSLRQAATPEALRGRVTSTLIFISVSLAPLGSLAGGALAEWIGMRETIAVCGAVGVVMGAVLFKVSSLPSMRELPVADQPGARLTPERSLTTAE